MKERFTQAAMVKILLMAAFFYAIFGCVKNTPNKRNLPHADQKATYDLSVTLVGPTRNSPGSGFIHFHHDSDTAGIIALDTWVGQTEPNHSYILKRAVSSRWPALRQLYMA